MNPIVHNTCKANLRPKEARKRQQPAKFGLIDRPTPKLRGQDETRSQGSPPVIGRSPEGEVVMSAFVTKPDIFKNIIHSQ